jgi:hypothetical protein
MVCDPFTLAPPLGVGKPTGACGPFSERKRVSECAEASGLAATIPARSNKPMLATAEMTAGPTEPMTPSHTYGRARAGESRQPTPPLPPVPPFLRALARFERLESARNRRASCSATSFSRIFRTSTLLFVGGSR